MGRLTSDIAAGMRQNSPPVLARTEISSVQKDRAQRLISYDWPDKKKVAETLRRELVLEQSRGVLVPDGVVEEAIQVFNREIQAATNKLNYLDAFAKAIGFILKARAELIEAK